MDSKFIFITGGVVSSLGKGLASASLGSLLQSYGYKVRLRKLDPYLNVDPGTMSPTQHGEVFVTEDGAETDLDLGHYERFTDVDAKKGDNITTGRLYWNLIEKERRGDYLGNTVQVIPHVTDLIKEFIMQNTEDVDFVLCEIGGTVGDIEALPFFEAIRQLRNQLGKERTLYTHVTLVPYIKAARELKTKPTQHSVKELRSIGIQPDIILCRSEKEIPEHEKEKISLFCNVPTEAVITAPDVDIIYQAPIVYHQEGLDIEVLKYFNLYKGQEIDLSKWEDIVHRIKSPAEEVKIAVVGKYTKLSDAYKSLAEALTHGSIANNVKLNIKWINARVLTTENYQDKLADIDGILVPGGFGNEGTEGKILAVQYARENNIPYFGICLGMQMAAIEAARNLLGLNDASSTEFGPCAHPVIGLMSEWFIGEKLHKKTSENLGGTMRLGSYKCKLQAGSLAAEIYDNQEIIHERHRHRYEFNLKYKEQFEQVGIRFAGMSPDNSLTEIIENIAHPWFIGVQFHPELKSRPFKPHPLFKSFIKAVLEYHLIRHNVNNINKLDNLHAVKHG